MGLIPGDEQVAVTRQSLQNRQKTWIHAFASKKIRPGLKPRIVGCSPFIGSRVLVLTCFGFALTLHHLMLSLITNVPAMVVPMRATARMAGSASCDIVGSAKLGPVIACSEPLPSPLGN